MDNGQTLELTREEIDEMIRKDKEATFKASLTEKYTKLPNKPNGRLLDELRSR